MNPTMNKKIRAYHFPVMMVGINVRSVLCHWRNGLETMDKIDKLCLGCMKDKNDEKKCPLCGYVEGSQTPFLPLRTVLQQRYVVGKMLDVNSEGVTYLGWDNVLEAPISIREFCPSSLAERDLPGNNIKIIPGCDNPFAEYKNEFLKLARSLARLREVTAIAVVYDIFEQNGTAYFISEYHSGIPMQEHIQKAGRLNWEKARTLFLPVVTAVELSNSVGVYHLGISPGNIIITRSGTLKLIGFSINAVRTVHTDFPPQFYAGYTALEQYAPDMPKGTCTDVYGLTATMFYAVTGITPKDARQRVQDDKLMIPASIANQLPHNAAAILSKGLKVNSVNRIKNAQQLKHELCVSENITGVVREYKQETAALPPQRPAPVKKPEPAPEPPAKPMNKQTVALLVTSGILLVIVAVLSLLLLLGNSNESGSSSESLSSFSSEESSVDPTLTQVAPSAVGQSFKVLNERNPWDYLTIELAGEVFDDTVAPGYVVRQEPEEGTAVAEDSTLKLFISKGPYMRKIPDVRGADAIQAVITLMEAGFKCVPVDKASDDYPDKTVISTDPPEDTLLPYGTEVFVMIAKNSPKPPESSYDSDMMD